MKYLFSLLTLLCAFCFSYAQNTTWPSPTSNASVGIGISSPLAKLDVVGSVNFRQSNFQFGKFGVASNPAISIGLDAGYAGQSTIVNGWANSANPGIVVGTTRADGAAFTVANNIGINSDFVPNTNGNPLFYVAGNGKVGISTAAPEYSLQIGNIWNDLGSNYQLAAGGDIAIGNTITGSQPVLAIYEGTTGSAARIKKYNGYTTFSDDQGMINLNSNVGIGITDTKGYKFAVNGSAIATSMTVKLQANWPDYVFKPTYQLKPLSEVKTYIDQNQHLPEMPSAADVEKAGLNLGEMVKLQTKKIEELTLYLIEKDKEIKELKQQTNVKQSQQKQIDELNKKLEILLSRKAVQ